MNNIYFFFLHFLEKFLIEAKKQAEEEEARARQNPEEASRNDIGQPRRDLSRNLSFRRSFTPSNLQVKNAIESGGESPTRSDSPTPLTQIGSRGQIGSAAGRDASPLQRISGKKDPIQPGRIQLGREKTLTPSIGMMVSFFF